MFICVQQINREQQNLAQYNIEHKNLETSPINDLVPIQQPNPLNQLV